jgi:hypothetical protein
MLLSYFAWKMEMCVGGNRVRKGFSGLVEFFQEIFALRFRLKC